MPRRAPVETTLFLFDSSTLGTPDAANPTLTIVAAALLGGVRAKKFVAQLLSPLVAARIIGKRTADEHVTQKPAAVRDFRQRWIILQSVRVRFFGSIENFPICKYIVFPCR